MTDSVERDAFGRRIVRQAELATILHAHGQWLRGEDGGKRADLSGCVVERYADLTGADLTRHGSETSASWTRAA